MTNLKNEQEQFWSGQFGKEYTDRNSRNQEEWDQYYTDTYGITKLSMNEKALYNLPKDSRILEVGCNTGMQLAGLQLMGFTNLYGLELQPYAVELAKKYTANINIIQGSGFDIPYKDHFFDLVCTNGLLIHIAPDNLPGIMKEIYRCSGKYIMGFEYYTDTEIAEVNYRGNTDVLWKADYAGIYRANFPDLKEVSKHLYTYRENINLVDSMFLLSK